MAAYHIVIMNDDIGKFGYYSMQQTTKKGKISPLSEYELVITSPLALLNSCKSRIGFNDFVGRMTEMEKYIKFLETQLKTKNEESILLILILRFCSAF